MFRALKKKSVYRLWLGQVLSAIGDEVYKVAFIWLAVGLIGSNTGYLASLQIIAVLIFGILGGKWSDRWNPYKTMISVDLLRAVATLAPVLFYFLGLPTFIPLVFSSIIISGLSAFFEPAIQASLPLLCDDPAMIKGANGLLATTMRFARVAGPTIIGLLSAVVATIHFFTINAFSFVISAFSIFSIRKEFPPHATSHLESNDHILKSFLDSWKVLKKNQLLYDVMMAKTLTGGAWGLAYGLGIALLIHEISPDNVKAFGLVMGAYGFGNVVTAIVVGNMERKKPAPMVYLGLLWLGLGFIGIAISYSLPLIMFFAAFAAVGGPLNDLPCNDMIQFTIAGRDLPKIIRLRMVLDSVAALVFMLASPLFFKLFSVRTVILGCGGLILSITAYYFYKMRSFPDNKYA